MLRKLIFILLVPLTAASIFNLASDGDLTTATITTFIGIVIMIPIWMMFLDI